VTGLSRRRFLVGLVTGIGMGAAGAAATWFNRRGDGPPPPTGTKPAAITALSTTTTTAQATTTTTATITTTTPVAAVVIPVICRDAWGAQPSTGDYVEHQVTRITIHHTARLLEANSAAPARLRQHQEYHQGLGWPDLAYHYVVDAAGNVYEGRPVTAKGDTATEYDPAGHLLVCCEGNFDEQEIPQHQYDALVRVLAWACAEFGIDPRAITGHRDHAATSCPGKALYRTLAAGALEAAVGGYAAEKFQLESLCGEPGRAAVGDIEAGKLNTGNQSPASDV